MTTQEKQFIKTVWSYYAAEGRHTLPWRVRPSAYKVLVSEIMLQQTQADRVIPKYQQFLKKFPTLTKLARASLGDVLREWQGLGYNRRAKHLHAAARVLAESNRGTVPNTYEALTALPGIGSYTASAVLNFAYNIPVPLIETNVRSVYLHHFFRDATDVHDTDLLPIISRTVDIENSREWFYALMDYGVYIKKTFGNPNSRSIHYVKQSSFKNSDRQIRGAILGALTKTPLTRARLHKALPFEADRIDTQLYALLNEGLVSKRGRTFILPL